MAVASRDRWEEKTQREGAGRRAPSRPGDSAKEDSAEVLRESVDTMDEEMTVRADQEAAASGAPVAEGSGEVGNSTVDEPTVEDSARPLPPLSVAPPIPQGKGRAAVKKSVAAGRLVVIAGNDTGRAFELGGKKTVIGRGIDCNLVLTDIAVSRRHVELGFDGKTYTLRDLGSGNGTLINDRIEDGSCQLRDGDRLELGNTVIRFEHAASKAVPAVVGFGQVEVDEEASTIAGNSSGRVRKGAPLPPPHADRRLVLPPLPPGAVLPAEGNPAAAFEAGSYPAGPLLPESAPMVMVSLPGELMPLRRNRMVIGAVVGALLVVLIAIIATVARSTDDELPAAATGTETRTAGGPTLVAAAGDAPLPASTWGTDERMLAARGIMAGPVVRPPPAPPVNAVTPDEPAPVVPDKAAPPDKPAPVVPDKAAPPDKPAPKSPPAAKPRPPVRTAAPSPKMTRRENREPPTRTASAEPKSSKGNAAKVTAARKKAESQYKSKQFSAAAATLRDAVAGAPEGEPARLQALATDYEAIGVNLSKAQQTQSSNPTESMGAYLRALGLDKSSGGGAHAAFIRIKLGQVAPSAAASYMAQKRYEAAKKACDAAVNYGAGGDPTVRRVRAALERKAAEMYQAASKTIKKDPDGAKKLLRRVIKMVPPDSPNYASAYKLLNARKQGARDEDE